VTNPRSTEVPRPKHAVSEGSMTLAEDKRPEANLFFWLRQHALQHHTHNKYKVTCHNLRWQSISWSPIKISERIAK